MRSIKYVGFSFLIAAAFGCSTNKTIVNTGREYDDLYGTSKSAGVVAYAPSVSKKATYGLDAYNDAYDPIPVDSSIQGTDAYYDENYVSSRELKRNRTSDAGYSTGYADGYSEGWNSSLWNSPYYGNSFNNSWNSFYSPFRSNVFGYSPFRSGLTVSFGLSPFLGWGSFNSFYDPWNSFYSPYGFNSYYGYNSFYGAYPYYAYGSPYYGVQPVYVNSVYGDTRVASRSYGPRTSGRASSLNNREFVNTRRPVASSGATRRVSSGGVPTGRSGQALGNRASTSSRTFSRTPATYDSYASSRGGSVNRGSSSARERVGTTESREYSNTTRMRSSETSSRPRSDTYTRSSSPSSSSGRSSDSFGGTFSRGSSSSSSSSSSGSYTRPSSSTRSSGSFSSGSTGGSYSRGSSSSSGSSSRSSSSGSSRGSR